MAAFSFIDGVAELKKKESIAAFYTLKGTEEFLKDHFQDFPVMPGVLIFEALKQAACRLAADGGDGGTRFRLVEASDLKFGQFVKPGSRLDVFARLLKKENNCYYFEGRIDLAGLGKVLSARFTLAPVV